MVKLDFMFDCHHQYMQLFVNPPTLLAVIRKKCLFKVICCLMDECALQAPTEDFPGRPVGLPNLEFGHLYEQNKKIWRARECEFVIMVDMCGDCKGSR